MYNGIYEIEKFAYERDILMKWLRLKLNGKSLGQKLMEFGIDKLYIYGFNDMARDVYQDIEKADIEVKAFVDQKFAKYKDYYHQIPVMGPDQIPQDELQNTYILVTPEFYFCDILDTLTKRGCSCDYVISIAMLVS